MFKTLLKHKLINAVLIIGMITLTAICILKTPDIMLLKRISGHSSQIMLLLFGTGLFFFVVDQKRLLFTSFGCVAALCLHFKSVANINLVLPIKTTEASVTIAQVSTGDLSEHWQTSVESLIKADADIISILEITPDWEDLLQAQLKDVYPNYTILTRIDILGLAVFSKFPITYIDTLVYEEVPHLKTKIDIGHLRTVSLYSFNTNPPLFRNSLLQLRNQLTKLADEINAQKSGCIASGNFNLDQFADGIQDFRAKARLRDSRKTMSPSLYTPTNHIFYSPSFECLRFTNLYDDASYRIGIIGEYQFRRDDPTQAEQSPKL